MDDMVAVDPKLFITCRLCLEEMGQYQIVPSVKEQLKFCFEIDVAPFDGLPQLICLSCKQILINYSMLKKKFKEKQTDLRDKLLNNVNVVQPQQDTVSSTQTHQAAQQDMLNVCVPEIQTGPQHQQEAQDQFNKIKLPNKRILQYSSSSDSDTDPPYKFSKSKKKQKSTKNVITWESNYQKHIMCKLCNTRWSNIRYFVTHNRKHEALRAKYNNVMFNNCTVNLNKIDNIPNITGLSNAVVHDQNKIIQNGNSSYYIMYSKGSSGAINFPSQNLIENINSDSTDEEVVVRKQKPKRKTRIESGSSSDTVVLESKSNKKLSDNDDDERTLNDCINIDDSSENESNDDKNSNESTQQLKKPMEAKLSDYKTIHSIISMCSANYRKKKEEAEFKHLDRQDYSENQLKRIILSIGRKVLNKQGFKCAGLLRYMEYKNLEINWITKPAHPTSYKEVNFIRIFARTRAPKTNDNQEWIHVENKNDDKPLNTAGISKTILSSSVVKSVTGSPSVSRVATPLPNVENIVTLVKTIPSANVVSSALCSMLKQPVNVANNPVIAALGYSSKLLNANPVANPKQLPKKLVPVNELKSSNTVTISRVEDNDYVTEQNFNNTFGPDNVEISYSNNDGNLCLPIITSTTSLAEPPTEEENKSTQIKTAPRIKVKPVSELMSERCLSNLRKEQQSTVASNVLMTHGQLALPQLNSVNNILMPSIPPQLQMTAAGSPLQIVQLPYISLTDGNPPPVYVATSNSETTPENNDNQEFVILNTVELPNTKTCSPFNYLKNLLQIHNLVLVDSKAILSREFKCLVKFKVVFKQDTKDQPVVLCLALLCSQNMYCLKVKDSNQGDMDVYKLTANWQWEILKVYSGDVVNKVLQNSEKISQETHNLTNKFICLLKSIIKIDT